MSHTTPSIYPASVLGGHGTAYQPPGHSLSYYPTNTSYNPTSMSSQYNTLSHNYTANKTNLMGMNSLGHTGLGQLGQTGMGQTSLGGLGQTSVLGSSLAHQGLSTSMGGGVMGTAMSNVMAPGSNYATNVMSNATFTNPLGANNPQLSQGGYNNPVTSTLNQYSLPSTYNPVTTSYSNNVTFSNPLSSQFNSLPLSGPVGMSIKLKPLEEVELGELNRVQLITLLLI